MHDALNRVTEVVRSNGTKTEVSYDAEDHITKLVNTCGSCGKVISTYEYKYNDQGYVVGETATELEAGTRKTPSWEDWYNWGDTQKETDKADCEHQEKEIQTTRTYEYDDNWELTRCTEKAEGGKKTVHNYTYDKIGNRTSYEKIEDGVSKAKYNYKYNDSNQLIKRTNAKIWGNEVLIPENQRTEDGDSPKEQLASMVKGGSNAKGYTLTEYINDINRENTEVLAEYGADEKVRQAYTYGESGIGERVSVDKSEESSYYLYDGRNSVTGILTENANLTNSYQYDPYGNLTSGTADGVNYYGYNGESTNVKTGLQYLRARYYNAENGTFTTEDSDLGTTENPLTRNRYAYTSNNPVNYDDPTGHSWWKKAVSAVKNVGKKIVNTAKKVVKTVVNTVKNVARTVVNAVKQTAKTVRNAVTHTKTYQYVKNRVTSSGTYQKIVSKGSNFIRNVGSGLQKAGKTYTSFQSYVAERRAEIRAEVVRQMCTTADRITDQLGKVNWKNVAIGVTAMVVSGVVVAATGGLAAGAVLAALPAMGGLGTAMVSGAVAGAIGGASYGAISSGLSGNSLKQIAKDTITGGLTGAISGGILGGLTYGAGKAIGAVKDLVKGSSSATKPGHITEMATKDLSQNNQLLEDNKAYNSFSELMDADEAARYNKHWDTIKAQEMQKQEITKFENGIKDGVQYTNQQKGNYAEMKMDQYYDSIGFERISQDRVTGLNDAGHQGLDGVYQNKGTNEYIVGEAKYNTSKLSTLKDGTKQMSKKWIGGKRLEEAVGTEKANLIGNNYERNLYNIKKNGSLNFKVLNN